MNQTYITLNNGTKIPQFGMGVYMMPAGEETKKACLDALNMGDRHIDTAHAYQNERSVGEAVRESGIPREEIWVTSKLWPSEYGEGRTMEGIDRMLERLKEVCEAAVIKPAVLQVECHPYFQQNELKKRLAYSGRHSHFPEIYQSAAYQG
jgi:diketogulonate reductase-like aldo/keto reductase